MANDIEKITTTVPTTTVPTTTTTTPTTKTTVVPTVEEINFDRLLYEDYIRKINNEESSKDTLTTKTTVSKKVTKETTPKTTVIPSVVEKKSQTTTTTIVPSSESLKVPATTTPIVEEIDLGSYKKTNWIQKQQEQQQTHFKQTIRDVLWEGDKHSFVQGMTRIGDLVLYASYSKEQSSKILVTDINGDYYGDIILPHHSHVGGMSYDEENNILFVSGSSGRVIAIDYQKLKQKLDLRHTVKTTTTTIDDQNSTTLFDLGKYDKACRKNGNFEDRIIINTSQKIMDDIDTSVKRTSTLTYHDGYLYVGTFSKNSKGEIAKFKVEYDPLTRNIQYNPIEKVKSIEKIQGIDFAKYNDREFLLLTQSYGIADSEVHLYEKIPSIDHPMYVGSYQLQNFPGAQGINVSKDGQVIVASEMRDELRKLTMDELIQNSSRIEKDWINELTSEIMGWF